MSGVMTGVHIMDHGIDGTYLLVNDFVFNFRKKNEMAEDARSCVSLLVMRSCFILLLKSLRRFFF